MKKRVNECVPAVRRELYLFFYCSLFIVNCSLLGALDFGLVLNNYAGYGNVQSGENGFEYEGSLTPRLSFPAGDNGEIYISASLAAGYKDELLYYPELLRTEYSMRSGGLGLKIGRFSYKDPLGYIAQGLFDGIQVSHSSSAGRFSFSGLYTGFIYKKTSYITMTAYDEDLYNRVLDFDDFNNTYFGSRRALAAIEWEHPSVAENLSLKISLLGQFDLNNKEDKINSQYFILKMGLPVSALFIEAGGSFSSMQAQAGGISSDLQTAFSLDLGFNWTMPVSLYSRLSLSGNYTSGSTNEVLAAFMPVSTVYAGNVFQAKHSALTAVSLDYSVRANRALGLSFIAAYFVQNDLVTGSYYANGQENNEFFLGPEFHARMVWSPVSDLQFTLGGGAFVPALGNNWPDADIQWKMDLKAVLAIF